MKFLIDSQLPPILAAFLNRRGHDCVHISDLGLLAATDLEIWTEALRQGRGLVSKDEDFVFLANRPDDAGILIWVRFGNCRNSILLDSFARLENDIAAALASGQRIIELR